MEDNIVRDILSVSCTICFNNYERVKYEPCTLICGHTFCKGCASISQRCPICKKVSGSVDELQPNYEMMNMIDNNNRFRLRWIEMVKKQSPEFWSSVKIEEDRLNEYSRELDLRYETMEKDMVSKRNLVKKHYNEYMERWKSNYDLLFKSKKEEENVISDLQKIIKNLSSSDSILNLLEVEHPQIDDYMPQCREGFEKYKSELLKLESGYKDISLKPHTLDGLDYTVKIYQPDDVIENVPINRFFMGFGSDE